MKSTHTSWLPMLLMLVSLVGSNEGTVLRLKTSHPKISIDGTINFTITCKVEDSTSDAHDSDDSDPQQTDVLREVHRLRILKSAGSTWNTVVEFDPDWKTLRLADDVKGHAHRETDKRGKVKALAVTWNEAEVAERGEYMCELLADSVLGLGMVVRSPRIDVKTESPLSLEDLYLLVKSSNAKLDKALAEIKANKDKIEKALEWQARFDKKERSWPQGQYSLLQPEAGCPEPTGWVTGWFKHHTESSGSVSGNRVSNPAHMRRPIMEEWGGQFYMTQHFCTTTKASSDRPWPKGTYCVMRHLKNCPSGFRDGSVSWDDEDSQNNSSKSGTTPGNGEIENPKIHFCCRRDRSPTHPILMPTTHPFYLHRYQHACQVVQGMSVSEEWMYFQTEFNQPNSSADEHNPATASDLPDIKLNLCYYQATA